MDDDTFFGGRMLTPRWLLAFFLVASLFGMPAQSQTLSFPSYTGPSGPVSLSPGQNAWVAMPDDRMGDIKASLLLLPYKGTEGEQHLFTYMRKVRRVPSVFIQPLTAPKSLKVGTAVFAPLAANSGYGKVASVSGNRVKVKYVWVEDLDTAEFNIDEVIPIDGSARFGAPVAFRIGSDWSWGQLIHKGSSKAWVAGWMGKLHELPVSSVRPLVIRQFKPGDRVQAAFTSDFAPGTVVATLKDGLSYNIKFDNGTTAVRPFAQVMAPLK